MFKPTPITVKDRAGKIVQRLDGVALDGDAVQIPIMLMDEAAAALLLTDAQLAFAQQGIQQALAHHAARGNQVRDGGAPSFGLTDAEREAAQGARDAQSAMRQDAWKPDWMLKDERRTAGRSYEDRMSSAWKEHR